MERAVCVMATMAPRSAHRETGGGATKVVLELLRFYGDKDLRTVRGAEMQWFVLWFVSHGR